MKKIMWAIVALLGFAVWAEQNLALECPGVTFSTDDGWTNPWYVEAGGGKNGGAALRSPDEYLIDEWDNAITASAYAKMNGAGVLTFTYKISHNSADWNSGWGFDMYKDEDYESTSYAYNRWEEKRIVFYEGGEHQVSFDCRDYSRTGDWTFRLSDFVWTPAPEKMTVTFDANGGEATAEPREYAPGDTYNHDGDEPLPVPTRSGWTFLGWYMDSVDGALASANDRVPLTENITLVAKWGKAATASIFADIKSFKSFKAAGADKWYMVEVPDLGTVAEVMPKGKMSGGWLDQSVSSLQVTSTVAGYLTFHWSLTNGGRPASGDGNWPYAGITLYIDGKEVEYEDVWRFDQTTGDRQLYLYVPAGKHTLKWEVEGRRSYSRTYDWESETETEEFGTSPVVRLWGVAFEPAGKQPDLQTWSDKVKKYKSWRTGDLARFAADYKTRMIADPEDYEARILFAVTRLGVLAENKQFTDYAKTFGFTVDWARLSVTPPTPKFDKKSAAVNAMVDKTIALATPAINEAKAALAGIPEDWSGKVTLDAEVWPIDETVAIDAADVQFARAGLDAALAGLNFLGAYDLTVNWPKVNDMVKLATKIPVVKALPKIGETEKWEATARCFRAIAATEEEIEEAKEGEGELSANATGALAVCGSKLALRLAYPYAEGWLNETNQVRELDFYITSGDTKLNVWAKVYGENGEWKANVCADGYTNGQSYQTATNVTCWVYDYKTENELKVPATISIRGNELVLTADMAKVNLGTKKKPVGFAKKSWTVSSGSAAIGTWGVRENPQWTEPWWDEEGNYFEPHQDGETGEWVDTNPDVEQYVQTWAQTGEIRWEAQSDAERKVMKFINDQTALFSKVRDAARLGASRRLFKAALERALVADGKATARSESDDMHFFEYDLVENQAVIDCARANTQRALAAIDAPTAIDFAQVAEEWDATGISTNKLKLADYDYTLLPHEGVTKVYLGALFEGKITRDLLPPMRTNAYGEIVPDFDAMQDPTIGGLFPEMTHDVIAGLTGRFEAARELDHGEWTDPESLPKPGEKLTYAYEQYKDYAASGLPKGWTWNAKTGVLSGTAASTFTVTFSKKGKPSEKLTIEVGAKPAVLLFSDDEAAVTVTGTGLYNVGATVKAVAAVKNGFAFGGWYGEDGELVSPLAVYSFKMTREDVVLTATTIPLGVDRLYAKPAESYGLDLDVDCGDLTPFQVKSVSPFSVSVSGLPPGLSTSNDMTWVEDEGEFSSDMHVTGTPTKAGVYYTTFVAKNNGGFKWTAVVKFVVGDAEENEPNTAGINWDSYVDGEGEAYNSWSDMGAGVRFEAFLDVPNSPVGAAPKSVVATKTVKKKTTNTLPSGLAASFKDGRVTVSGVPTTAGKYTMEFTVTYANKKTAKAVKTVVVKDNGSVYIPTGVIDNDPNGAVRGTVTYVGVKQYGQTVKFTATTKDKKKWFFGGWFLDEALANPANVALPGIDSRAATVSAQIGETWSPGDGMFARFVTKAEEAADGVEIVCDELWRVYDADTGTTTNLPIEVVSATKPTLTASGLPAGTKLSGTKLVVSKPAALVPGWYKVTLTAKTAAGNTAKKTVDVLVPNVTTAQDRGLIEGLYTGDEGYTSMVRSFMKAGVKQTFTLGDLGVTVSNGWTLAVTGLPKGWTYNASTKTFSGVATKVGKTTVTFTVSQKVGRKTTSYKATATFDLDPLPTWATGAFVGMAGNAYVRMDVASNGAISGYRQDAAGKKTFTATGFTMDDEGALSTTLKGKGVSLAVLVHPVDNLGVQQGVAEFDAGVAFSNPWGIEGAEPLPVFADDASLGIPVGNGTLTLKFGAKGAVTCTYKVGKNATSGSTQICMVEWSSDDKAWFAEVPVALAVKKDKKGKVLVPALVEFFSLKFVADDEGNVATAEILMD